MIVIIEGTDLGGKSTLAARLGAELKIGVARPWVDMGRLVPSVTTFARSLRNLARVAKVDVIYDRFFISEYVYGQVKGREYRYVADLLVEWGDVPDVFVVHVTVDDATLAERYTRRGNEQYVSLGEARLARDGYVQFVPWIEKVIPVLTVDTSAATPEKCTRRVIEWLRDCRGRSART